MNTIARGALVSAWVCLAAAAPGCSSTSGGATTGARDGGTDAASDARGDARGDASRDASHPDADASKDAPCSFDGHEVASGASVTAYEAKSVDPGSVCVSQQRTCHDGALSGTFAYDSCSV